MTTARCGPSGLGPALIATYSTFVVCTTVVFALRVYVRMWKIKRFGYDDWTAAVGWLFYTLLAAFVVIGACHGAGQHEPLIQPPSNIPVALKFIWVAEALYTIANMMVKLSICLMLLRLVLERSHQLLVYGAMGTTVLSSVGFFFVFIFQCDPVPFFWQRGQENVEGKCMSPLVVVVGAYAYTAVCIITDWIMALLPWFLVRGLQMDLRTKTMVIFVLAMGSIASIAAIGRIGHINQIKNTHDLLYTIADAAIWCACETGLGLFASCAATLKPLFQTTTLRRKPPLIRLDSYKMPDTSSTLRPGDSSQKSSHRTLETITEHVVESQVQYHATEMGGFDHCKDGTAESSRKGIRHWS